MYQKIKKRLVITLRESLSYSNVRRYDQTELRKALAVITYFRTVFTLAELKVKGSFKFNFFGLFRLFHEVKPELLSPFSYKKYLNLLDG